MSKILGVGYGYADVIVKPQDGYVPQGDEKVVANEYSVSCVGGNAVSALALTTRLGLQADLFCQVGMDRMGRIFRDALTELGIGVFARTVPKFPISIILLSNGKRAMIRCRDEAHDEEENWPHFPRIDVVGYTAYHTDGHHPEAALHYAKKCREAGILTSFDGGGVRSNTDELLEFIDVAVVSERMCEQMKCCRFEMLRYLQKKGCRIGAVTLGERGIFWYDESGRVQHMPALEVPSEKLADVNGAGDFFHGGYLYSYAMYPYRRWEEHLRFGRAAATFKLRRLGNEAALNVSVSLIETVGRMYKPYPQELVPA